MLGRMTRGAPVQWARPVVRYVVSLGSFVLVWYAASRWENNPNLLPSPQVVFKQFVLMVQSGELLSSVWSSLGRLLLGYALGALVGVPLGFAMGMYLPLDQYISPLIEILRPISSIAWLPLGLFIFGVGNALPLFIIFYGSVFPFVINTIGAVHQIDNRLVAAARTLGAKRWLVIFGVIAPAALPLVLVGARIGLGIGWMAVIAAELVGAPSGLGYLITWYETMLLSSRVLVGVFAIGMVGYLLDLGLRKLSAWLTPWWDGWRAND